MMAPTLSFLFATVAIVSTANCLPPPYGYVNSSKPQVLTIQQLQAAQPTDGLVSNSNVTLQYVGLGVGVQNYTCANTSAAPTNVGAIATLFDITKYLQAQKTPADSQSLPGAYLDAYDEETSCTQDASDLSDNSCEEAINSHHFAILGKHYFASINGKNVPTFDIYTKGAFLSAQKIGDVPAPAGSPQGNTSEPAVDWLFLPSDGTSRTHGLSEVYRINTAGGNADPSKCAEGIETFSVKYAAEYWFYL